MKVRTLILAGLMLSMLLGAAPGQALAGEYEQGSAEILANDAGLSLEGLRRDQALLYDLPQAGVETPSQDDDDQGVLACHFTNGCGYAVNPQVMIDLQYRIVTPEESGATFARNDSLADRLAPNVMFGLRYSF